MDEMTLEPRKWDFIRETALLCCDGGTKQQMQELHSKVDEDLQPWAQAFLDRFYTRHPEIV